jgi:ribonuclease VapC
MSFKGEFILDASALLAVMLNEPGHEKVREVIDRAHIHAVNAAEVLGKLAREGVPRAEARESLDDLNLDIDEEFSLDQAALVGELLGRTRKQGLSLGDCVCLACAIWGGATAVTADRRWQDVDSDYEAGTLKVRLIR